MALAREHELHRRRFGRNLGVGLVLAAFVAVVFGLTIAKVGQHPPHAQDGEAMHVPAGPSQ